MKFELKKIEDDRKFTVEDLFPDDSKYERKTYYLDENGNRTTPENAKKAIIAYYDENGRVVKEERANIEAPKTK